MKNYIKTLPKQTRKIAKRILNKNSITVFAYLATIYKKNFNLPLVFTIETIQKKCKIENIKQIKDILYILSVLEQIEYEELDSYFLLKTVNPVIEF